MAAAVPERPPAWPSAAAAWGWLALLVLAYTSSFVDRQILSLMVDSIKQSLGITDTQFGLLQGLSFAIFYTTLGIPIGALADISPRRTIVLVGLSTWSIMTALCGAAGQFWHLFLARIGVGVGEAALSPAAYSLLADCFPPQKLGRAISIYFLGAACGSGLALILGGWVIQLIASAGPVTLPLFGELASWQAVFICVALPGLPIALLISLLREPARHGHAGRQSWHALRQFVAADRRFLFSLIATSACFSTAVSATVAWTPAYFMRVHAFTATQVGYAFGSVTVVAMASGLLFGAWLADRLAARGHLDAPLRATFAMIVAGIPFGAAALLAPDPSLSLVFFGMLLFCNTAPGGICATAIQMRTPNRMRGRMSAIYLFATNVVSVVMGPLLPALLTDYYFGSPTTLGHAIVIVTTLLGILGACASFTAMRAFRPLQAATTRSSA